jgi:hypothetical protein
MVKLEPDCAAARKELYSGLLNCNCLKTTSISTSPFNIDTTLAMDGRLGPIDCTHNNATLSARSTSSSYPVMFIAGSTISKSVPSSCNLQACDVIQDVICIREASVTTSIFERPNEFTQTKTFSGIEFEAQYQFYEVNVLNSQLGFNISPAAHNLQHHHTETKHISFFGELAS